MKEKVFCSECIHCNYSTLQIILCEHPNNIYPYPDSWFMRGDNRGQTKQTKRHPKDINKKNNCKWYEKRGGGKKLL